MWPLIKVALTALLPVLGKWLGGGDKSAADQRELGRAEQQNTDMKGEIATVRAANQAAQAIEHQPEVADDPNDRANRR